MQARGRYVSGPSALLGTAALAAAISFSSGAIAQSVSAQAAAAAAAPAQASAPAQAPAASSGTLPAVNVNAEKPQQKPVQRQVKRQGPNREPIKIPVNASGCKSVRAPGKPYFVEFRSRTAVSYGHTFVVHGRLGEGNRYASYQIAGLHPKGDDPNVYMQGMMVPVESETGPSWGDEDEQYLTARFCVTLTEAEYRKALAYIKTLQATKKTWHATTYNCNAFAADIARHIGLDSPNPNMYLPQAFITRMADLNKGGKPNNPFAANFSGFQQAPATQPQRRAPVQRTAQPRQTQQPTQQ